MFTTYEVFLFWSYSYYFRMFKKLIDNLIPTGIMKYLIENYFTKKLKFVKFEEGPKVLSVEDLLFGFKIWFGSCLISTFAFMAERRKGFVNKPRKMKFIKVSPHRVDDCGQKMAISKELMNVFRIKL